MIKLGDSFKYVSDYQKRFSKIPNILELDHLTVSGDVTFGSNVVLRVSPSLRLTLVSYAHMLGQGTVIIVANFGQRIDIPSGAILENKVVSGNLRILDH